MGKKVKSNCFITHLFPLNNIANTTQMEIFNIKEFRKDLVTKRIIVLNLRLREAAMQIGISASTLSRIENCKKCDVETFAKCCVWLGTKPETYFNNFTIT